MDSIPMTYRAIVADMDARIRAGEWPPGSRLPTYVELARMYRVGGTTAARVYATLVDRGLVVGATGRGMFVAKPLPPKV